MAQYATDAHRVIAEVTARGHLPILCGGTGLYIQAVTENLSFSPEDTRDRCREELKAHAAAVGGEALLAELAAIDPETAARLHPNDEGRIIRALEVYRTTGHTMTEFTNIIVERYRKEHPELYEQAKAIKDSL